MAKETAKVFLLMPFSEDFDWLRDIVVTAGDSIGVNVERADSVFEAGIVAEQIGKCIQEADAIVAVCTGQNANVFFELGLADRFHWPVLLAESRDDLPFDLRHYRTLIYGGWDEEKLRESLAASIEDTIEAGRRNSSAMVAPGDVPPPAKPRVLGQFMMQVHVWGLERAGLLEHIPVDVLLLAQDVEKANRSGGRAHLADFPKRLGVFAETGMVIPAAEEAGVINKNYDPDNGDWYVSLTGKGSRLLVVYEEFLNDMASGPGADRDV